MEKKESLKRRYKQYMLDHEKLKIIVEYLVAFLSVMLSAFIFAYNFRAFISPILGAHLVSGGMSGAAQIVVQICVIAGVKTDPNALQSIFFLALNVPIIILGWLGVGKRFAVLSLVNVIFVSLFISIIPDTSVEFISLAMSDSSDLLARALFAGVLTSISSIVAFKVDASAGGIDVISMYIANKKSTSLGKYIVGFNAIIIISYTLIEYFHGKDPKTILICLYTIVYLFSNAVITDMLNTRNKKAQLQIITNNESMPTILIANLPHGCTVLPAKGAFSKEDRQVIYMSVSSSEVKKAIALIRKVDPSAFVNVSRVDQVYGRFYIRPFK